MMNPVDNNEQKEEAVETEYSENNDHVVINIASINDDDNETLRSSTSRSTRATPTTTTTTSRRTTFNHRREAVAAAVPPRQQQQQQQQQVPPPSHYSSDNKCFDGNNGTNENDDDDRMLHRAVADAGRWAYGTVLVELWVWNETKTLLSRPTAGWWVDPVYQNSGSNSNSSSTTAANPLYRLTDTTREDYVAAKPVPAGVGLPGILWSETRRGGGGLPHWFPQHHPHHQPTSTTNPSTSATTETAAAVSTTAAATAPSRRGGNWRTDKSQHQNLGAQPDHPKHHDNNAPPSTSPTISSHNHHHHLVAWRDIKAIANDPDEPWDERLQLFQSLGLGWAAGVAFDNSGTSGIVLYVARNHVDMKRLQCTSNEEYLIAAAHVIASSYALRIPRQRMQDERRAELISVLRRIKIRILALRHMGINIEKLVQDNSQAAAAAANSTYPQYHGIATTCGWCCGGSSSDWIHALHRRMVTTILKARGSGANIQAPPAMGWEQSWLTFVGCFITLAVLTRLNVHLEQQHGNDFTMTLPLFGALMALLYGLTAAPASQPRNIVLGQGISMIIALSIGYMDSVSDWLRQTLAASLSIACMVKLGVTHPPGGAVALLFATGSYGWGNLLFVMIGNVMAIICAAAINNWSDARQFPSYWGLPSMHYYYQKLQRRTNHEETNELDPDIKKATSSCTKRQDSEESSFTEPETSSSYFFDRTK